MTAIAGGGLLKEIGTVGRVTSLTEKVDLPDAPSTSTQAVKVYLPDAPSTQAVKTGSSKVDDIVKQIDEIKKSGGEVKINKHGDPVIMKDGQKVRIDHNNPHGDKPHFHFEKQTPSGKWKDAGPEHRYYFKK